MSTDPNKSLQEYLEAGTEQLRSFLSINVVAGHKRELERITKYYLYWNFYEGNHYRDYNDNMLSFNYVRTIIDKVNSFLLGDNAFSFSVSSYFSDAVSEQVEKVFEELVMYHWRRNKKTETAHEILQMGSICGDVWIYPSWDTLGKFVKIRTLDSRQCYPEFKDGDISELSAFQVRVALEKDKDQVYALTVTRYTKNKVQTWKQKTATFITTPEIKALGTAKKHEDVFEFAEQENALGFIPIVHIKNKPKAASYFSTSDASDILKINKVFNEMNQELKVILDYHTNPVTVVTGANLRNAKRGAGSVWSGLPSEANVFNLGLDADVSSYSGFLKDIKSYIHEISDVPDSVLGKVQSISGTSAAALKLTYQPLVQQADKKALTYGEGISELNAMMIKIIETYGKETSAYKKLQEAKDVLKTEDLDIEDVKIYPVFSYGFPLDRMGILQEAQIEKQLGIGTRKEFANRLGKNNVTDLLQEVDDETIKLAQVQSEANSFLMPSDPTQNLGNPADTNTTTQQ